MVLRSLAHFLETKGDTNLPLTALWVLKQVPVFSGGRCLSFTESVNLTVNLGTPLLGTENTGFFFFPFICYQDFLFYITISLTVIANLPSSLSPIMGIKDLRGRTIVTPNAQKSKLRPDCCVSPNVLCKAEEIQLLAGNMATWNLLASFVGRWGHATELWLKKVRVLENSERWWMCSLSCCFFVSSFTCCLEHKCHHPGP